MAGHVASLPGFIIRVSSAPGIDVAKPRYQARKVERDEDLVALHGKLGTEACEALAQLSDDQFRRALVAPSKAIRFNDMPRYDALRGICFNHLIHHRGQLTMYLRAIDVPVPALYGPSADENPFGPRS